jgi:hypothetical protein
MVSPVSSCTGVQSGAAGSNPAASAKESNFQRTVCAKWCEDDDHECQSGLNLLPERLAWHAQSEAYPRNAAVPSGF